MNKRAQTRTHQQEKRAELYATTEKHNVARLILIPAYLAPSVPLIAIGQSRSA